MQHADCSDHYEVLQVSPRADQDTIERVFRHLAKRFHPDNAETGNAERFSQIVEAYRVLSDPEVRASFDAKYTDQQQERWQLFDQAASVSNVESDRRIRLGLLTVLYQARRRDVDRPGLGTLELERILDCPQDHMKFHVWYMKEQGWVERLDNGTLAITADGVDHLAEQELPWADAEHTLPSPAASDRDSHEHGSSNSDSGPSGSHPNDRNGTAPPEQAPEADPDRENDPAAEPVFQFADAFRGATP